MQVKPFDALVALIIVLVTGICAAVALAVTHTDPGGTITAGVLAIIVPTVGYLLVAAKLTDHSAQLTAISENTNGKLDARIRAGVVEAMAGVGLIHAVTQSHQPAAPVAAEPPAPAAPPPPAPGTAVSAPVTVLPAGTVAVLPSGTGVTPPGAGTP